MSAGDAERLAEATGWHRHWSSHGESVYPDDACRTDTVGREPMHVFTPDQLAAHDAGVAAAARREGAAEALREAADDHHDRGQTHTLVTDASRAYRDAWMGSARDLRARADALAASQGAGESGEGER